MGNTGGKQAEGDDGRQDAGTQPAGRIRTSTVTEAAVQALVWRDGRKRLARQGRPQRV